MSFIEDLISDMNEVKTYDVTDGENTYKTIRCDLVCDIVTILFHKYGLEERLHDDLHG